MRLAAIEQEGGTVFVAVGEHEEVLGLVSGTRYATLHAGAQVAYITALVISTESRRQGIGRALVEALEHWAREHGCTRLSVTSAEHRADAHAFYPRCGMPYSGLRFTKNLESVLP
jgi:GNAT superfamily N-acetyltransferase